MDLRRLRYFVNVAETASVSKAALRVHISQPALSRQIHDLEIELGLRLFDRVGRRIRLTPEGEDLLERSRDLLARAEAIRERARQLTAGAVGRLRVGATSQTFQSVMAGFLAEYRRSRPSIEVTLTEAGGVRLLDLVAQGDLDLAVGGILPGASRFGGRLLFPIRLLAIAAAGRRWKQRATIEVADLANEPLLLLNRDFGTRQLFDAACRITHIQPQGVMDMVRLACPDSAQAQRISESFGLAILDSDGIRDLHERLLIETADALKDGLSERAMQIHLQRIVGAYVGSAHGAGQFYSRAVTEAREATAKLANDSRNEDLDGPVGFDSQAQRKREFAADMGVQAHALRMAAEGAVAAYEKVVGETWKPFERPVDNTTDTVGRKAAKAQMSAFD